MLHANPTPDAPVSAVTPQVVLAASQMLGALSPLRLASISQRWQLELGKLIRADASSPARQQLYDLCHGLRYVRLAAGTPEQLEASTEFLRLAHPLTYVAPDKKSRVQQAICDMLAGILQPLADAGEPRWVGWGRVGVWHCWYCVAACQRRCIDAVAGAAWPDPCYHQSTPVQALPAYLPCPVASLALPAARSCASASSSRSQCCAQTWPSGPLSRASRWECLWGLCAFVWQEEEQRDAGCQPSAAVL